MTMIRHPMEWPLAYRLWQAPFADRKLAPVLAALEGKPAARVLDIGCGPGTNAHHFAHMDYLGIDNNPRYIETATRRHGPHFRLADARRLGEANVPGDWDCVLINSLMHHLSDEQTDALLTAVPQLLSERGRVHILDLVLPARPSVSWALARLDRGDYPRPLDAWRTLIQRHLEVVAFTPYPLGMAGVEIWSMVHCIAVRRVE